MTGFVGDTEKLTKKNKYFRQVLFTGKYAQLVVMCLKAGEEIGNEVHDKVDQFFRIEAGDAKFIFGGSEEHLVHEGDAAIAFAHAGMQPSVACRAELMFYQVPPLRFIGYFPTLPLNGRASIQKRVCLFIA